MIILSKIKGSLVAQDLDRIDRIEYRSGSVYEGEVVDGCRDGLGTLTLSYGSSRQGYWREDHPVGRGTFFWPDGRFWTGYWVDGKNRERVF